MLHYDTITPATRELLNRLMLDDRLQDFVFVKCLASTNKNTNPIHLCPLKVSFSSMTSTEANPCVWPMESHCNGSASRKGC